MSSVFNYHATCHWRDYYWTWCIK